MAIGLGTYQDTVRREDLISEVTNISPDKTPLLSGLPMGSAATNTLHEYPTDTFTAGSHNAAAEGAPFTAVDLTAPTRANNVTQIFTNAIEITGTEQAVKGVVDPETYQVKKTLKEHALDIETAFMAGSRASGNSGVARQMTGIINALTTNATTQASNATLTEDGLNDLLELIYASTNDVAGEIYVGGRLKRTISGFTAGNTKNVDAQGKKLVNTVDIYESDFGIQKVFLHRDVPNAASGRSVVAINPEYHRKSFLRNTSVVPIAKVGDADRWEIITEATLEHRGEASGAVSHRYQY